MPDSSLIFDPIIDPFIAFLAAALVLAATLVLFLSLKRDLRQATLRERRRVDQMIEPLQQARGGESGPVYIPVAIRPGFNIHRRVHAMRLLRRGEDVAHVAAALGVPRREVELLVRVQQVVHQRMQAFGEGNRDAARPTGPDAPLRAA